MSIEGLSEALFAIGAVLVSVAPRYKCDSSDWIGGGALSRRFRQALVVLGILNIIRNLCMQDRRFILDDESTKESAITSSSSVYSNESIEVFVYYTFIFIDAFGIGFLMLLTPYCLQCHLASMINIRPGQNLLPWLYGCIALQLFGVIGSATFSTKLYAFKRLGDAVSSIPVLQTLRLYRKIVISRDPRVITIQTVQTIEEYNLFLASLASVAYWYNQDIAHPLLHNYSHAIRLASIFVTHTRTTFHALLLNLMDEAIQISEGPDTAGTTRTSDGADNDHDDSHTLPLVSVKRRSPTSPNSVTTVPSIEEIN
jgi:hypothetical protein